MLDSPDLRIAVRRHPLPVERDLRSTTVPDDPVQRRDLILLERARDGDLDAFNDLVTLYQDQLYALVVRMVPDRDQAADAVQEGFFSAFLNLYTFRGGSVKAWLNRFASTPRWTRSVLAAAARRSPIQSWRTTAGSRRPARRPIRNARLCWPNAPAPWGRPRLDHGRPANGNRAVRHRGL